MALPLAYPSPRDAVATATMRANRRRDTKPELALRRELHRRGLRYRVDSPISPPEGRPVRPDIVFSAPRVAVFMDGCFWHGCPAHGYAPRHNAEYWLQKIDGNRRRDARDSARLRALGWTVLHLWEHDGPIEAADAVQRALASTSRPLEQPAR